MSDAEKLERFNAVVYLNSLDPDVVRRQHEEFAWKVSEYKMLKPNGGLRFQYILMEAPISEVRKVVLTLMHVMNKESKVTG